MKDKIKVLIISHMFPSNQNPIMGSFIYEQVIELAKHCDIKVIAPLPYAPPIIRSLKKKWLLFSKNPYMEKIDTIEVYRPRVMTLPKNLTLGIDGFFYLLGILKTAINIYRTFKFDIIHVHSIIPDGFAATLLNKIFQRPLILTVHGRELHDNFKRTWLIKKEMTYSLKKANYITVVSSILLNKLHQRFPVILSGKAAIIYNGFNSELFKPIEQSKRKKPSNKIVLLTVANLLKIKGHEYVLRALKLIINENPNIVYYIIGDGPEKKRLIDLCTNLEIDGYVVFLGRTDRKTVAEYIRICDVFIMTSLNEGFGIVYLEAMSQGKPVIGSLGQGISDIIDNGINGFLLNPMDVQAIASTLVKLINDSDLREVVGENAKKLVWGKYTWEYNAREYTALYKSLFNYKDETLN